MLSVLIPTYNYVVVSLVESIYSQLEELQISFEIICFDNGSKSIKNIKNERLNSLEFCVFQSLEKNGGRSKIRNLLAEKAKYKWLLFLDADTLPVSKTFINKYLENVSEKRHSVFYGGLKYKNSPPSKDKLLRWVYGKKREEVSLKKRNFKGSLCFSSANFMIEKKIFRKFKFDESLVEYGHEDSLLAIQLKKNNIQIVQLNNPVFHLGLDNTEEFILKTKKAIENLLYLYFEQKIDVEDNKLLQMFIRLKKTKMVRIFSFFFNSFSKRMESNFYSGNPSIFIFDLYRLGYLCSIYKE